MAAIGSSCSTAFSNSRSKRSKKALRFKQPVKESRVASNSNSRFCRLISEEEASSSISIDSSSDFLRSSWLTSLKLVIAPRLTPLSSTIGEELTMNAERSPSRCPVIKRPLIESPLRACSHGASSSSVAKFIAS